MSEFKEWRFASGYTYDARREEAWNAATHAERERCAGKSLEFCHCSKHYTARGLIDPTCDCHDIAAAIREATE